MEQKGARPIPTDSDINFDSAPRRTRVSGRLNPARGLIRTASIAALTAVMNITQPAHAEGLSYVYCREEAVAISDNGDKQTSQRNEEMIEVCEVIVDPADRAIRELSDRLSKLSGN